MSEKIEGTEQQAEQTTALAKYRPTVLNGGRDLAGGIRKAAELAVHAFAAVTLYAVTLAIAMRLLVAADPSEKTLLLNLYTFGFCGTVYFIAKAFRIVRGMFGKRSE